MGRKTTKLARLLDSAPSLLSRTGEEHWASWLKKDATLLNAGDFDGIEHFLRAFGGMGSINDRVPRTINGYRLKALLSKACKLATQIRDAQ